MPRITVLLLVLSVGCGGGIRLVVVDDEGGLIELSGEDAPAREAAIAYMRQHCHDEYRVTFDGEATVGVGSERTPTAGESARRMALPSDLPGAIENPGTEPAGGSSVDDRGNVHVGDVSDGARDAHTTFDRRRRIEYECSGEGGEVDEDGDGVIDVPPSRPPA